MSSRPAGELEGLTGLRGIAAITVVIAHARFYEMVPSLKAPLIFFEWHPLAVDLFFMLSGFVLVHVYAAKFASRTQRFWLPYLKARVARIVPLYLATLLSCLGIFYAGSIVVGKWPAHVTWQIVFTNLLLVQGWPGLFHMSLNIPSWSLSVEAFCYIFIMPFALLVHQRVRSRWMCLALITFLVAWRSTLEGADSGWIGLFRGISGFLAGAMLHRFCPATPGPTLKRVTFAAVAAFLILQSFATWGNLPKFLPLLTFPILIHCLAVSIPTAIHAFFRSKLMLWLGDISYSTYLWHGPIFLATHSVIRPRLVALPLPVRIAWITFEFSSILIIAHLSYHYFEGPLRSKLR